MWTGLGLTDIAAARTDLEQKSMDDYTFYANELETTLRNLDRQLVPQETQLKGEVTESALALAITFEVRRHRKYANLAVNVLAVKYRVRKYLTHSV